MYDRPRVTWAHFCDYAFFDAMRKVCLIGIFNRIHAQRVPAQHTQCYLAFEVAGAPNSQVDVRVQLLRPDRDPLFDASNRLQLSPMGVGFTMIGFDNLLLPDFGPYEARVSLNGELAASIELIVQRAGGPTP